ncbi:MAG: transcriptional regulator, partial [Mycobacterium sp.]|nr:transcriptional regulator [Mycobacterium sp.]
EQHDQLVRLVAGAVRLDRRPVRLDQHRAVHAVPLPEGRDDRDGWRELRDSSGLNAVARAQAGGHLAGLDFELG